MNLSAPESLAVRPAPAADPAPFDAAAAMRPAPCGAAASGRAGAVDWSQLWRPGPGRVFTPQELAIGGIDRPGKTLPTMAWIIGALLAEAVMQAAPPQATATLMGLFIAAMLAAMRLAPRIWTEPSRRTVATITRIYALGALVLVVGLRWRGTDPQVFAWTAGTALGLAILSSLALLFLAFYRAEQIGGRLREQAEREQVVEMARQLAAAQIQPHFLFNSLASLQHWVQAQDPRAAPLLDALCGYLRATLPLFQRSRLRLGDEAEAVRQYLEVMRLRLGERLRFGLEIDAQAAEVQVPPGLLLTLTENAVVHGVQASLKGAEIRLRLAREPGRLTIEVSDTGPGPAPGASDGVGLSNCRARLVQAYGRMARLELRAGAGILGDEGAGEGPGCVARIEIPLPVERAE